ncbi:HAD-IA family hydrolase [Photorhabdus sp. CRCIA-P01]|uniref:HAD-IA family hydrolase n=1 Tax=Photorhabdus sp. CRCIA-P01 TaxID=2019570 RepID=UPI000E59A71B|nr:HAD-IA family hydrolase [Photorhabdus sp. CRCIA-P01]
MINSRDISVVVQGQINSGIYNKEQITWTEKCLSELRDLFPDAELILSTWNDTNLKEEYDVDILVKNKPISAVYYDEFLGIYDNTNRQIVTTIEGLKKATRKYTLKIRTDTVLFKKDFLDYFNLYNKRNSEYSIFDSRIVASAVYAKKYAGSDSAITKQLFQPSDIILFGNTSDLIKLYDIPLNAIDDSRYFKYLDKPCLDVYTHMLSRYTPEQHIFISCLRKAGKEIYWPHRLFITDSLQEESERYICDNYVFLDQSIWGFELKGHIKQRLLDDFVWNGLYRYKVWLQDYNKYYHADEKIAHSADERSRNSLLNLTKLKSSTKKIVRYGIISLSLLTRIKYINRITMPIQNNIYVRRYKEEFKRKLVNIPNLGKQGNIVKKDKKAIKNISELLNHINGYDVISFDIFDTLLRRYVEPVYVPLAQTGIFAEYLLKKQGIDITADLFNRVRQETVNEYYENNRKKGLEYEYVINDVIIQVLTKIGLKEDDIQKNSEAIVSNELNREIETLYVAKGVDDLLEKIKASGKVIIATSDIYFSTEDIKYILLKKGLLNYFNNVYVSSSFMVTKHSGRLFDLIKDEFRNKKILHVGDNLHSDAIAPRRRGIYSLWLNDDHDLFRRLKKSNLPSNRKLLRKIIMAEIQRTNKYEEVVSKYIYKNVSFDFISFSHHIIQYSYLNNIERIYFLERDGTIFCDLIQRLANKAAMFNGIQLPELIKLKMPRRKSAPLSDIFDPYKVIKRAYKVGAPDTFSVSFVLGAYGVSKQIVEEHVGTGAKSNIDSKEFIDNFKEKYQPILEKRRQEVLDELSLIGFFKAGKMAVVDIGWGGTTQKDIGSYIHEKSLDVECHGIYYGVDGRIHELAKHYPHAHKYFGYHDATAFFGSYSLIEFLIKNYSLEDNHDVSYETLELNNTSRNILLSAVDAYTEVINKWCLTANDISVVSSENMINFVNKPDYKFVNTIKDASFSLDRKEDDDFVPLVQKLSLNLNILKTMRQLDENAQWVWGSLVYSKLSFLVKLFK